MSTAERDLVDSIRAELAVIVPPRQCCRGAELAGLAGAAEPRRRKTIRLGLRLRPHSDGATPLPAFDWDRAAEHCRIAWLRGRFLGHGSLSLASGRTHLEFVLDVSEAGELCDRLALMEMPATWRIRRGRGVVTWKSVEKVGTFLKILGGGSSLLEMESRQVSRSVRGDLNRVINAESANLGRAVAAAARQIHAIDALEADGRLSTQPYLVRLVADTRREVPEATLTELAERLALHRSAVQRALDRMDRLALHPDEPDTRRRGR